jgi:hypothetical protein
MRQPHLIVRLSTPAYTRRAGCALLAASCSALLTLAACQEAPVHDLGFRDSELVLESPAPRPEFLSAFDGVWVGEAEDPFAAEQTYRFPSGASQIVLDLASGSSSKIIFGSGPSLAPATDPDHGYPLDPDFSMDSPGATDRSIPPPAEGFAYGVSVVGALRDLELSGFPTRGPAFDPERLLDGRVEYNFGPNQVFASWCALQTPESYPAGQLVTWSNGRDDCVVGPDQIPMDCQKASLARRQVCTCDVLGCRWSAERIATLTVGFDGDGLVGIFSGAVFVNERGYQQPLGVVRFQRRDSPGL